MQRFKLSLFIISFLLSFTISCSQNKQFDPDMERYADLQPIKMDDGRYLFSWQDNYKSIRSIYLIANLQGKKKIRMVDLNNDGVYRCALSLPPATYYYKFLINDKILVIPQHETIFSRRMGNSGKLFVPDESKPFVSRIVPRHGEMVTQLSSIKFKIGGKRSKLDLSKLRIYINNKRIRSSSKSPYKYEPKTGWCEITSFDKSWGAKVIKITGADKNKRKFTTKATIYLYPKENKKEKKKTLQGATGYQLLVPYFNSQDGIDATLKTLLKKIDYLNSSKKDDKETLGIKLLILHSLMPAEDSYHRITKSYNYLDKRIANNYLLKKVAAACRKRGISLVTRYNSGYMSNGNPIFQAAYGNPVAFQKNWFIFFNKEATHYQDFLNNPNKPLLNLNNKLAANSFSKNIITWLKRGFKGIYFEKAGLQANTWWRRVRRTVPSSLLIAETTGGRDYKKQIFKNKFSLFADLQFSKQLLLAFSGNNPRRISDFMQANSQNTSTFGNLIHLSSSDDSLRPATILDNKTRLEAMLGFLLTSGGIPVLNWGDELGKRSRKAPLKSEPIKMAWKKVTKDHKNPLSLLNMIKTLSSLRLKYEELNREIKNKKKIITWAKKTASEWSVFLRATTKKRFFIGITAFEPTDEKINPIFNSKLNIANGIYWGKDLLLPSGKSYKVTIKNGKLLQLQLPIKNRGFNLFLFEKKEGLK